MFLVRDVQSNRYQTIKTIRSKIRKNPYKKQYPGDTNNFLVQQDPDIVPNTNENIYKNVHQKIRRDSIIPFNEV